MSTLKVNNIETYTDGKHLHVKDKMSAASTFSITGSLSSSAAIQGQSLSIQHGATITGSSKHHGPLTIDNGTVSSSGGAVFGDEVIASHNLLVSGTFTVNGSTIQFGDAASDAVTATAQFTASQGLASVGIITSSAAIKGQSLAIQAGVVITGSSTHHGTFTNTKAFVGQNTLSGAGGISGQSLTAQQNITGAAAIQGHTLAIQNGATITGSSVHHGQFTIVTGNVGIGKSDPYYMFEISSDDDNKAAMAITQYDNDTGGDAPNFYFRRSRGTSASRVAVQDGDDLGAIDFFGHDGNNFEHAAGIRVEVDGSPADDTTDMPGRLLFLTTADGSDSASERMRISSNGLVNVQGNLSSAATVSGQALSIQAGATITGSSLHHGTFKVESGLLSGSGGMMVGNVAEFSNDLKASGTLEVGKSVNISGSLNLSGTLTVSGTTNLLGNPSTIRNTTILDNYNAVLYGPITVNAGGYFKIPSTSAVKIKNISDV